MWLEAWRSVSWSRPSKILHLILWHTSLSHWHVRTRSVLSVGACLFYFRVDLFLSKFFSSQFGLSLLYALLSHGEKLLSSGVPLEPSIGDFETWWAFLIFHDWDYSNMQIELSTFILFCFFRTDTIFQVAGQLSQCSLVEPLLLPSNLLTLFCRYLDKRTVHQLKSNME